MCRYCKHSEYNDVPELFYDEKDGLFGRYFFQAKIIENHIIFAAEIIGGEDGVYERAEIYYCPMCGRDLRL